MRRLTLYGVERMAEDVTERCFKENDSDPPACGVHHVLLIECETTIDMLAPYLGTINCLTCPVSQLVVLDSHGNKPRDSN
jgi:hypothetical protein